MKKSKTFWGIVTLLLFTVVYASATEPTAVVTPSIRILSPQNTVYSSLPIQLKFSAEGAVLIGYSLDGKEQKLHLIRSRDAVKNEIKLVPVSETTTTVSTGYKETDYVLISPDANILISLQKLDDSSATFVIVENKETKTTRRDTTTFPKLQTGIDLELHSGFYIYATEINPSSQYVNLAVGRKSEEFSLTGTDGLFVFDLKVDAGKHAVKVFAVDKLGKKYSSSVSFSFKPERALPVVEIASPLNFVKVFNSTILVSGTASSSAKIEKVEIKANDELYLAEGTTTWKKFVVLKAGENVISVKVTDINGDAQTKSIIVYYIPPEKLARILAANNITPEKIIAAELKNVSKFEGERYLINKDTSELRKAAIEIKPKLKAGESKDAALAAVAAKRIVVKEYTKIRKLSKEEKIKSGLKENEDFAGTFVEVDAEDDTEIEWAIIKLYFSEDELRERKLQKNRLFLAWYDDDENSQTYGKWIKLRKGTPEWVHDVGINKEENYLFANVSHFSIYALAGVISQETTTTTPSPTMQPPATQPPKITSAPQTSPPAPTTTAPQSTAPPASKPEKAKIPFSRIAFSRIAFVVLLLALIAAAIFFIKKQKK